MRVCLLAFDFDGLILETEGPIYQSWNELYQSQGQQMPWDLWVSQIGVAEGTVDLFGKLEELVGHSLDRDALLPSRWERERQLILSQPVQPGVMDYLQDAQRLGLKIAVASSSSRQWVTGHLLRLGLIEFFDIIKCSDDVIHTKPAPDLYLAVQEKFCRIVDHVTEGSIFIAFEDSPYGIEAAKKAGFFAVAVPNQVTQGLDFRKADLIIQSLDEITLGELLSYVDGRSVSA